MKSQPLSQEELRRAILMTRIKGVDVTLLSDAAATEVVDERGWTPLHYLADEGVMAVLDHPKVAGLYSDEGVNSKSPLKMLAHSIGSELWLSKNNSSTKRYENAERDVLTFLGHPLVSSQVWDKTSPLHILADEGCVEVLKHPLGATLKNDWDETPLHRLADALRDLYMGGSKAINDASLSLTLQHPLIAVAKDKEGLTPLHLLARNGFVEVLSHSQVAIVINQEGETPLHLLAKIGREAVLSHPKAFELKDFEGMTPLQYLAAGGNERAQRIMKSNPLLRSASKEIER